VERGVLAIVVVGAAAALVGLDVALIITLTQGG
jgi:hypothetical protein